MNSKQFCAVVISVFLIAPIAQADEVPLSAADDAAIREVVQQYFDAYAAKDLQRWSDLWSPQSPHFASWKARQQEINAGTSEIALKELTIVRVKVTSNVDFVNVEFRMHLTGVDLTTGQPFEAFGSGPLNRILELHKENDHWRVWSYYLPEDIDQRVVELSSIRSKQKRAEVLEAIMASLGEATIPDGYTEDQAAKYVSEVHDAMCSNFLAMAYSQISDLDRRRQFLLEEPLLQSNRYPVRTLVKLSGQMFRSLESKLRFLRAAEEITIYQDDLKAILWCRQHQGMLLEQEGRLEEALLAFEDCKKMFPDDDPNPRFIPEWAALHFGSLVSAARISMKLGHRQAAIEDFDSADRFLKTAMQLGADHGENVATIPYIRQLQELQRIQSEELQPLFREGKFVAALQTAERIKVAEESVYGTVNKNVADTCQWMCEIQAELGQFEEARASIQHAREIYNVYGTENPYIEWSQQYVRHLTELSAEQRQQLLDARQLKHQETTSDEQAIAKWQAIYVTHRDILDADDDLTAYDLYQLGRYQFRQGNFSEGANSWRQAAPIFRRTRGDDSKFVRDFYTELAERLTTEARTNFELCKFEEGRPWQAEILRVYEKYHGPDHKLTVSARMFLDAFDRAIALSAAQADQLKTAWEVLQQQRSMLTGTEQSPQAIRLATDALDTIGQLIGTQNVMHYSGRLMLTFAHMKFGEWTIAEQELRQEIDAPYCAPMPPAWQMANWLTTAKLLQGKLTEAEQASADAVRMTEQALGPMDAEYFSALSQRATILRGLMQDDALRNITTQAFLLLNFKLLPPGHASHGSGLPVLDFDGLNVENKEYFRYYEEFLGHWFFVELRTRRYQAAARGVAALQDLTRRVDGEASAKSQDAMLESCRVYIAIGRIDEAIKNYEQVLAHLENLKEPTKDELRVLMECCRMLAQCYSHEKRIVESERLYLQSMQLLARLNFSLLRRICG